MSAIVLAFDGILASTVDLRAEALDQALTEAGQQASREQLIELVPGRSLLEVVLASVEQGLAEDDPTAVELIALRAQRTISQRMLRGVLVASHAQSWLDRQRSRGIRVILRADSVRTDVDGVLRMFDLEQLLVMVQCADDPVPRLGHPPLSLSSLEQSYRIVSRRLDSLRVSTERIAFEGSASAALVAAPFVSHASHVGPELFAS